MTMDKSFELTRAAALFPCPCSLSFGWLDTVLSQYTHPTTRQTRSRWGVLLERSLESSLF